MTRTAEIEEIVSVILDEFRAQGICTEHPKMKKSVLRMLIRARVRNCKNEKTINAKIEELEGLGHIRVNRSKTDNVITFDVPMMHDHLLKAGFMTDTPTGTSVRPCVYVSDEARA